MPGELVTYAVDGRVGIIITAFRARVVSLFIRLRRRHCKVRLSGE